MKPLRDSIDRAAERRPSLSRTALLCALVASATVLAFAQDVRRVDVAKLGPQMGATVPDFSLSDQHGKTWTLRSLMGPKGAMIVFLRSADW
jgi:hypothetical protein